MKVSPLLHPIPLACALAACADLDGPNPSGAGSGVAAPLWSVVTFAVHPIELPAEPGAATAVNDLGQVAGIMGGPQAAFLWANGATQVLTGDDPNGFHIGFGLNAFGLVVGVADQDAVAWQDGVATTLIAPVPGHDTRATAVNDAGVIVGFEVPTGSNPHVAVVWPDKTQNPVVLQGTDPRPAAISNAGVIVGTARFGTESVGDAAVWSTSAAPARRLKGFGGGVCGGAAMAVNEQGAVAGACRADGSVIHAAYWASADADAEDLSGSAGTSVASSINELGQLVGSATQGGDQRPLLWAREAGRFRVFELGLPAGVNRATAAAVSNTGLAVGQGGDGTRQAFRWHIPMQAALDLLPETSVNKVKLGGGGTLSVAILGSRWFRAAAVDPASLTLGDEDGLDTPIARAKSKPLAKLTDADRDGFTDLVAEFTRRDLVANGDLGVGTHTLILLGRMRDGTHLRGADAVQVVP